jgi:hypothetical protein
MQFTQQSTGYCFQWLSLCHSQAAAFSGEGNPLFRLAFLKPEVRTGH